MFDNYTAVIWPVGGLAPVRPDLDLSSPVMHAVDMTEEGRRALAEAVRRRRDELGLSQGDLKSRSGPGVVTVGNVERCDDPPPSRGTLAGLDRSLDWPLGTAAGLLAGRSVGPAGQPDPRPVGHSLLGKLADLDPVQVARVEAYIDGIMDGDR